MFQELGAIIVCFAWFYARSVGKTLTDDELERLIDEHNNSYDDRWCGYCRGFGICDGDHSFR